MFRLLLVVQRLCRVTLGEGLGHASAVRLLLLLYLLEAPAARAADEANGEVSAHGATRKLACCCSNTLTSVSARILRDPSLYHE